MTKEKLENDIKILELKIERLEDKLCIEEGLISELESKNKELQNKIEELEDTEKNINKMSTDEVAILYRAIRDSYHYQHLDKF